MQKLRNVELALNVLRENRVKISGINSCDIVDGNEEQSLQLVWAIILHWQFYKVLTSLPSTATFNTIEKSILSWCQQATSKYGEAHTVRDFTRSLADGMFEHKTKILAKSELILWIIMRFIFLLR